MDESALQTKNEELEALAQKASHGDSNALYSLCEKVAGSIFYHIKYMLGNDMDAEDVTQNVLLRMCERIGDLREAKAFRAWLGGIKINETRRHIALHAKYGNILNLEDHIDVLSEYHTDNLPDSYLECQAANQDVMEIVSHLPERQREAVVLHYYDDLSINEVARKMSIPHQNVSKYLAIAREKLKREMERKPFMARISAMAFMPASSLLSDTFNSASMGFDPESASCVINALAECQQYIYGDSPEALMATTGAFVTTYLSMKFSFAKVLGALSIFFVIGALALGIMFGGTHTNTVDMIRQPALEGSIIFSGGADLWGTQRVNPAGAELHINGGADNVKVVQWWITTVNSDKILYEGLGGDVGDVLTVLRESGQEGEYSLIFRFSDETGSVYRMLGNFFITEVY